MGQKMTVKMKAVSKVKAILTATLKTLRSLRLMAEVFFHEGNQIFMMKRQMA